MCYTYIYIYIYIHIHTYIHTYIHTHIHIYIYIYIYPRPAKNRKAVSPASEGWTSPFAGCGSRDFHERVSSEKSRPAKVSSAAAIWDHA